MRFRKMVAFQLTFNTYILLVIVNILKPHWGFQLSINLMTILVVVLIIKLCLGERHKFKSFRHCPECGINITNCSGHINWDIPIELNVGDEIRVFWKNPRYSKLYKIIQKMSGRTTLKRVYREVKR